ncbi:MAG: ATP-binding cassette domain-containing protein, partial [Phycisphaerales bacterium]|nr:ATP-binding cassette domain-containing protein [Phycisphaerales bacterium]
ICGLRPIRSGAIVLDDRDVTRLPPGKRGIGYVPQDAALFTTMRVGEQIGLALEVRGIRRRERRRRVEALAEQLRIDHLLDRRPVGLSGGERQRVAMGRALIFRPALLCLDEPLSALDDETHAEICRVLREVHDSMRVTVLHITHNRREAHELADHVLRLGPDGVDAMSLKEIPCESV